MRFWMSGSALLRVLILLFVLMFAFVFAFLYEGVGCPLIGGGLASASASWWVGCGFGDSWVGLWVEIGDVGDEEEEEEEKEEGGRAMEKEIRVRGLLSLVSFS